MIQLGYRAIYYENFNDKVGKVMHETQVDGSKVASGKITQSLSEIPTFEFELMYNHPLYNKIDPINGLVKVINKYDGEIEFYGRVLKPTSQMDNSGLFSKTLICESVLGYLQDSTQTFEKVSNNGVLDYFQRIINTHNSQVEEHKRFKIGKITVKNQSDVPYRYIGYETTFDTIKNNLVGRLGGYIQLRVEEDGLYLDYLEKVGEDKKSPIQLGTNIETASRELDLSNLITRLVPLGADIQDTGRSEETGQYVIRERVTIDRVNGGKRYIEDAELVKKFGIIQRPVDWTDIESDHILLQRGKQYMNAQKIAISSWNISVVELYLIDNTYDKFKLGNTHPVDNAPLSGVERLQIIKKVIDITQPESVDLTVGSDSITLSKFQLQQQEAAKSMEKVLADNNARQAQIAKEAAKSNKLALLQSEITTYASMVETYTKELKLIDEQISKLNAEKDKATISNLKLQKEITQNKLNQYRTKVTDLNQKITELNKGSETVR